MKDIYYTEYNVNEVDVNWGNVDQYINSKTENGQKAKNIVYEAALDFYGFITYDELFDTLEQYDITDSMLLSNLFINHKIKETLTQQGA